MANLAVDRAIMRWIANWQRCISNITTSRWNAKLAGFVFAIFVEKFSLRAENMEKMAIFERVENQFVITLCHRDTSKFTH